MPTNPGRPRKTDSHPPFVHFSKYLGQYVLCERTSNVEEEEEEEDGWMDGRRMGGVNRTLEVFYSHNFCTLLYRTVEGGPDCQQH